MIYDNIPAKPKNVDDYWSWPEEARKERAKFIKFVGDEKIGEIFTCDRDKLNETAGRIKEYCKTHLTDWEYAHAECKIAGGWSGRIDDEVRKLHGATSAQFPAESQKIRGIIKDCVYESERTWESEISRCEKYVQIQDSIGNLSKINNVDELNKAKNHLEVMMKINRVDDLKDWLEKKYDENLQRINSTGTLRRMWRTINNQRQ